MCLIILTLTVFAFYAFLNELNKIIVPTIVAIADAEMREKALDIINTSILDEYSKEFRYDDIIHIEKDNDGNIVLLKADTLKMNKIACDVSINAQEKLRNLGNVGIKIPAGYIFKNNILAHIGPNVTVKMEPIGQIETKYLSEFETGGINQTRHKIYVQVKTKLRITLPTETSDVKVDNEVPISETIIVGKIPDTAIQMPLNGADFKLNNANK